MKKAIVLIVLLAALSVYVYFTNIVPARAYDPTVRGSGTIEATDVVIAPKLAARIREIKVDEGDVVTAGQTLAVLDCAEIEARRAQAEAQVAQARAAQAQAQAALKQARAQKEPLIAQRDQARRDFERAKRLFDSASLPQNQYEKAEAVLTTLNQQVAAASQAAGVAEQAVGVAGSQIDLAESAVRVIDATLVECTLRAPIAGRVSLRSYEPGELALPGAALLKIQTLDEVHTWVYVPNEEIGRVRLGQKVKLAADTYPDQEFVGGVARIREEAEFTPKSIQTKEDRTRLVYGVKIAVPNPDGKLMAGMPVEAEWMEETK
ncbi:MAG: HlyD family efflux transporter periplasmic adaptor subunit [Myxococcales bacterium]|nr:MAG: HlyD family efflux transporter periplasmic adaptor subunit [Myxococcales bacterium]